MDIYQALKSYVSVIENNSFAAAAKALYRSPSQISKEVSWLEQHLGVTLIHRTTRKLSLSEEGQQFYQYAKESLFSFTDIKQQLQKSIKTPSGKLNITMPTAFGSNIMREIIVDYVKKYPDVNVNVHMSNEHVDLDESRFDLAIRTKQQPNDLYHMEPFIKVQRKVFASRKLLDQYGEPKNLKELASIPALIHSDMLSPYRWRFKQGQSVVMRPAMICNNLTTLLAGCINGIGCLYVSELQVKYSFLKGANNLKPILEKYWSEPLDLYFCYKKSDHIHKKIKLFIELTKKHLALNN